MANINFGQNVDLHLNQLLNIVVQVLASDPVSPAQGQFWYNSTTNVLKYYDGSTVQIISTGTVPDATTSSKGIIQLSNDLGGTATAPGVVSVGGASAANIADAVTKRHSQNTDTGTTQTSFQLDSGNSGPRVKNSSGVLEVRNAADSAYGDLRVNNLFINGNVDEITGTIVKIKDSYFIFNDGITLNSQNSNGGIEVTRLATDNSTRVDAKVEYNESGGYWQLVMQDPTSATGTVTRRAVASYSADVGNASATSFNIPHNLGTLDVQVQVYKKSTGDSWDVGVTRTDTNTVTLTFATAPASNEFRVVVQG